MTTSNRMDDDQEMSMDEILASIRRYVSADESLDKPSVKPSEQRISKDVIDNAQENHVDRAWPLNTPQKNADDGVVRLNERAQNDKKAFLSARVDETMGRKSISEQERSEPSFTRSFTPEPISSTSTKVNPTNISQTDINPYQAKSPHLEESLVSDQTLMSTMESFSKLREATASKTVPVEKPSPAPANQTLDQLFIQLARPMIAEWLERNLPAVVEKMVEKEIERISKY